MFTVVSLVCLWLTFHSFHCLTLSESSKPVFPIQFPHPEDDRAFVRINKHNQKEVITCPEGLFFDNMALHCMPIENRKLHNFPLSQVSCPRKFRGTMPNPQNCKTFFNCWDGIGYEAPCNDHLLYSTKGKRCEWPKSANCCEFWGKDPGRLVADM